MQIVGEEVHHLAQHLFVQVRAGIDLRQHILQRPVIVFDGAHGVVDDLPDLRRVRCGGNCRPARILRHKEDALGKIFVDVLLEAVSFVHQLLVTLLKAVGDVFQENQAEDDVLVFRSVHVAAQHACSVPDLFLKADVGGCLDVRHMSSQIPNKAKLFCLIHM